VQWQGQAEFERVSSRQTARRDDAIRVSLSSPARYSTPPSFARIARYGKMGFFRRHRRRSRVFFFLGVAPFRWRDADVLQYREASLRKVLIAVHNEVERRKINE